MPIEYKIKTANVQEVYTHLMVCNDYFYPPLNTKVDVGEYANKLAVKSITFEAWANKQLVGLVAVYMNDIITKNAFISSVSVLNEYKSQGIATHLLEMSIEEAKIQGFKILTLEASNGNDGIIRLYTKLGFCISDRNNELITMLMFLHS